VATKILKSFQDVEQYLDEVCNEADKHRTSLGFLPRPAYSEQAYKGQLWIAVDKESGSACGHLMFGGRFPKLKVMQCLVYSTSRKQGIGSLLINELISFGEANNYMTISARVAADLKSNKFWEKNGLIIIQQLPGGCSRNRLINIRVKELNSLSLFQGLPTFFGATTSDKLCFHNNGPNLHTPIYAIDLNVFFDITKGRMFKKESAQIIRQGLSNRIKLYVTNEFITELERTSNDIKDDPVILFAKELPVLPSVEEAVLDSLYNELRFVIFPDRSANGKESSNNKSDLIHLASCIHHKLHGFITREKAILRHTNDLKRSYGLEVVSPSELVFESIELQHAPLNVDINGNELKEIAFTEADREMAESFLLSIGLSIQDCASILDPGAVDMPRRRILGFASTSIIAIASWDAPNIRGGVCEAFLYINTTHPNVSKITDHLLESLSRDSVARCFKRTNLSINPGDSELTAIVLECGYRKVKGSYSRFSKVTYCGPVFSEDWPAFIKAYEEISGFRLPLRAPNHQEFENSGVVVKNTESSDSYNVKLFDFETLNSPAIILCPDRQGVLIPIRQIYANDLLSQVRRQKELFPSREVLLHVEKSYFKKPSGTKRFAKGMPVIFYVSSSGGGSKEAIGCARITYSDEITPQEACVKLTRQGVLSASQLESMKNKHGLVHAITFDNFNLFPNAISYELLKKLECVSKANLVTSEFLTYKQLCAVLIAAYKVNH